MAAEGGGLPEGPLDVGLQGRQVPPPPRPLRPPHEYSFPLLLLRRGRRALPRSLSPPPPPPPRFFGTHLGHREPRRWADRVGGGVGAGRCGW